MRSLWLSLHERLVHSTEDLTFQRRFQTLARSNPALAPFADPGALLALLHGRDAEPEEKNRVLAALVAVSQAGGLSGEAAQTMLWLALWPGLDAVHRRLSRFYRQAPEELVSEIAGRFTAGIARLDLSHVRRLAATLTRNIERDIRRSLGAAWADEARRSDEAVDDIAPPPVPDAALLGLPEGVDADVAAALLGERLRVWIGDDAAIVVAIAVVGETSHEVGARFGIDPAAVRQRYRRALARLRNALEEKF